MKRAIFLTLLISLISLSGFGQYTKDDVKYFSMDMVCRDFLSFYGVSYCDPGTRIAVLEGSIKPEYLERFEKHESAKYGHDLPTVPDTSRVVATGEQFLNETEWYDKYSEDIAWRLSKFDYVIIAMKEFSFSPKAKKYVIGSAFEWAHEFDPKNFQSIVITETFIRNTMQVSTHIYLRHKNGRLMDIGNPSSFSNVRNTQFN